MQTYPTPHFLAMSDESFTIPQGCTISAAYVEFVAESSNTETTDITIHGENEDNAARFTTTNGDITNRTETMASVTWNSVPSWTAETAYQTHCSSPRGSPHNTSRESMPTTRSSWRRERSRCRRWSP